MGWFTVRRWSCCVNVQGCEHARSDRLYSSEEAPDGLCVGDPGPDGIPGCGQPLRVARESDPRLTWARRTVASVAVVGGAALLWWWQQPRPLEHIRFASANSRVVLPVSAIPIPVVRSASETRRQEVQIEVVVDPADPAVALEASPSSLVFEAGESSKSLVLKLIPGGGATKGRSAHLTVRLTNVLGSPEHRVTLEPSSSDRNLHTQASQMVRSASVVAMDIAELMAKLALAEATLLEGQGDIDARRRVQRSQSVLQGNLRRAREAYAQFIRDMDTVPVDAMAQALADTQERLDRDAYDQQARLIGVMKTHLRSFQEHRTMNLDRWADELLAATQPERARPST